MKCYWILNHAIMPAQKEELLRKFEIDEIIFPSDGYLSIWSNLPAGEFFYPELVDSWIDMINAPDIAIVQGDSTYAFYIVDALLAKGVRVFASTSERIIEEKVSGDRVEIVRLFRHKAFREYQRKANKTINCANT